MRLPRKANSDQVRVIPASRGGKAVGAGGAAGIVALVLALLGVFAGGGFDYNSPFDQFPQAPQGSAQDAVPGAPDASDETVQFLRFVTSDINDFWAARFSRANSTYRPAIVNVFDGSVRTGCGAATSSVGPFYCPADEQVYLDVSFFRELAQRFQAPGDFAQAYVVAHEIGHHVQNLLGTMDKVHAAQGRLSQGEYNRLSVRLELQADFYAGIWARYAQNKGYLEAGDVEEALNAANSIGDDTIQRRTQGHVIPDSFTHGSSEQRMRWFRLGLETGDIRQGDTFSARTL